jgi:hypothetical protein
MTVNRRHRTRHAALAIATAAAFALAPATAPAAETAQPPSHLTAYNLDWLNYLAPQDMPSTRYAVCVVDSGLMVTQDTPADSPAGPVLERLATDDGPGFPQGTAEQQLHGSHMTMAINAPVNDWGTIGVSTWIPVVSVRAMVENELRFRSDAYRKGIDSCATAATRLPIAVVNLSLGCDCEVSDAEQARIVDAAGRARDRSVGVVASAGNTAGAGTGIPARLANIFAIGAANSAGGLCSYSSFDARVDVLAPACPVEWADPFTGDPFATDNGGSSTAAAITSALLAALRSLRPDAGYQQLETWIRESARIVDGRRVLDGELAANAAGLQAVVARARARMASVVPSPTPTASATPTATAAPQAPAADRLKSPAAAVAVFRRGVLRVAVARLPAAAQLRVVAEQLGELGLSKRRAVRAKRARRMAVRLPWRPDRITLSLESVREFGPASSRPVILRRISSNRYR